MPEIPKGPLRTILVVDHNESVLHEVVSILENARFRVLSANDGKSAISLTNKSEQKIDLLLSNVSMPEMSGPDLGETLKKARPDMHVMLMSTGYNGRLLVLNYGWALLPAADKAMKLVEMVRDVLSSPNRSQAGGQQFDSRKDTGNPACDYGQSNEHPANSNEPQDGE